MNASAFSYPPPDISRLSGFGAATVLRPWANALLDQLDALEDAHPDEPEARRTSLIHNLHAVLLAKAIVDGLKDAVPDAMLHERLDRCLAEFPRG